MENISILGFYYFEDHSMIITVKSSFQNILVLKTFVRITLSHVHITHVTHTRAFIFLSQRKNLNNSLLVAFIKRTFYIIQNYVLKYCGIISNWYYQYSFMLQKTCNLLSTPLQRTRASNSIISSLVYKVSRGRCSDSTAK